MSSYLTRALQAIGDTTPIRSQTPVSGGCISEATCVQTDLGRYFLKTHRHDFFHAEAHGLKLLRDTTTLGVPEVLAVESDFLLLEWIPHHGTLDAKQLGSNLAAMHRTQHPNYGLERDNYIGANPQKNHSETNWVTFFGLHRLKSQALRAADQGRWNASRDRRLERLLARLEDILPSQPVSSLLHGDLWSGNVMGSDQGKPYIIDPAVYFGDRETDIAFSKLFGGFSAAFYEAYEHAWPLESGWQEREEIYNLYHLLNHLNLFGEGYGSAVDRILATYGT